MNAMPPDVYGAIAMLLKSADVDPGHRKRILRACRDNGGGAGVRMITTRQAAQLLECCPKTVLRYAARGLLTAARRSARCLRFRRDQVEALATGDRGGDQR
ncbi:helix-turn-helix domain-containing protein [Verrucomicrobiota bacterium]